MIVMKRKLCLILFTVLFISLGIFGSCIAEFAADTKQTPIETAAFEFRDGIPMLNVEGIGTVDHPARVANYALAYMGAESYSDLGVSQSDDYAANCIAWLKEHISIRDDLQGWAYTFDSTYNDITIGSPWYSAFGNACGIEALVRWYEKTKDVEALNMARDCAMMLYTPISEGGLMYQRDDDIWFEEIPSTDQEPSHILNGHMRACIALHMLYEATKDEAIKAWYERGVSSLYNWLPLYDNGYWLRYDLNPKKKGLLFRFNNPYGDSLPELAIDEIRLTDPLTGESVTIDVGNAPADMDPASGSYLAGLDWQAESLPDGHTVRRLAAEESENDFGTSNAKPNSYFYLNLPSEWTDNLRTDWFEMTIVYKDEKPGHVCIEQRAISPDEEFVELRDGDILLTGSGEWREWKIPLRPSDLGWPVGMSYAEKHTQYLETLADSSPELKSWVDTSRGYYYAALVKTNPETITSAAGISNLLLKDMPKQNVILPLRSTDDKGVALQHYAADNSEDVLFDNYILPSCGTKGYYSPFLIAEQALGDAYPIETYYGESDPALLSDDYPFYGEYDWILKGETAKQAPPEPAYEWLQDNAVPVRDGYVWQSDADNTYNDLHQDAGWQSAFWQRYIIDAFTAINDENMVRKAAYAYSIPTDEGGLCSISRDGTIWFEEVPNNSHILNADLASIVALQQVVKQYPDERIEKTCQKALCSLRENLYRFDTGYWTKYDMNPKKEILFALEWEGKDNSPKVDTIWLYNPDKNVMAELGIGDEGETGENGRVSGNRWTQERAVDGRMAREIAAPQAGDEANGNEAFFRMILPGNSGEDFSYLPNHYIVIRYKDTSAGIFTLTVQSIADGNNTVMVPLRHGNIESYGDNEWKTAVIELRPQDMGWYMGPDYQAYHNEQLGLIAQETGDWYFNQTVKKWESYLDQQKNLDARSLNIEGRNQVIFADTGDLRNEYIPQTGWRDKERTIPDENCSFSLIDASQGFQNEQAVRFFHGESSELIFEPGQSVLIELNGAHWIHSIEMGIESDSGLELSITDVNQAKRFFKRLFDEDNYYCEFDSYCLGNYLRIANEDSASCARLKRIVVTGKPTLYEQVLRETPDPEKEILDAKNTTNPLSIYRIPIKKSIYSLADRLLMNRGDLSHHQKMMVFMDFISDFYIGLDNANHYLALSSYIESCGGYSNILAALAASQGYQARIIALSNYPPSGGHVTCEVFYDGQWHLYDPTYGAYYTTMPREHIDPYVLGYEELTAGNADSHNVFCVVTTSKRLTSNSSYSYLGPRIYEKADPKGPIGPDHPMIYPLAIDLSEGRISKEAFDTKYQGISYIGVANINASQLWLLRGLEIGKKYEFIITGDWLGGEVLDSFEACLESDNTLITDNATHIFIPNDPDSMEWIIEFTSQGDAASILLTHHYPGPEYRYIRFSSFELRIKNEDEADEG